jgi:threonine/homoserine/homoserine lactone efflux protein
MDYPVFFKAALIGLSVAAPVGPIGLLCIQRSLTHGARIGFISGLGAAAADGLYGAIGAFGLVAITQFFVMLATPLAIAGAIFLSWMGWQMLRAKPAQQAAQAASAPHAGKAFLSVFILTLANPMTILSFVAVFAAIGGSSMAASAGSGSTSIMLLGILSGSALWWLSLASSVALLRHKITARVMRRINQVAGLFLLGFAAWQLLGLLRT